MYFSKLKKLYVRPEQQYSKPKSISLNAADPQKALQWPSCADTFIGPHETLTRKLQQRILSKELTTDLTLCKTHKITGKRNAHRSHTADISNDKNSNTLSLESPTTAIAIDIK